MPTYIWTAKDQSGRTVVRKVDAASAEASKASLIADGHSNLSLVGDEVMAAVNEAMPKSITVMGETVTISDEDKVKHFGKPSLTFIKAIGDAFAKGKSLVAIALVIAAYQLYRGSFLGFGLAVFGLLAWIGFVVSVGLPSIYYGRLHKADDWERNDEVFDLVDKLKRLRKIHFIKVPLFDLARFRAKALARTGRLDQGLAEWAPFENTPGCPRWLHKAFIGSIYDAAKQHDTAHHYRLDSIRENMRRSAYLDIANYYLRRKNDAIEGRVALAEAEHGEITEGVRPWLNRCRGILAFIQGDYSTAKEELEKSIVMMEATRHLPYRDGSINIAKAYLCCTLAKIGDTARAKQLLTQAQPYLKATRETELLAMCESLVLSSATIDNK